MSTSIQTTIDNIEIFRTSNTLDLFTEQECISILETMTDAYHNDIELSEQNDWTDALFDEMYLLIKDEYPSNPFFATIGSTVRTGKVTLPYQMGSLNQTFTQSDIDNWINSNNLTDATMVISAKYDGNASEWLFSGNDFIQSFSRGNGTEGADTTRHVKHLVQQLSINNDKIVNTIQRVLGKESTIAIRGEVIWNKTSFDKMGNIKGYKNPRNAVSGLMNKSESLDDILPELTFFPFNIDTISAELNKVEQLELLAEAGFAPVLYTVCLGKELTVSMLQQTIVRFRHQVDYELDGVVIEVNDANHRIKIQPSNSSLNPEYAFKFKIDTLPTQAKVTSIEWNISKHGYYKPTILYYPVDIGGVTCTRATGFNAAYIVNNNIGPGSIIEVVRKGDVVPNCVKVIRPTKAQLPEIDQADFYWTTNKSGTRVDIVSTKPTIESKILKMVYFAEKLHIANLGEGNIRKIHDLLGITETSDLIKINESNWVTACGSNGTKIFENLQTSLSNVDECVLAAASGCFNRGIGERKLKNVLQQCKSDLMSLTAVKLLNVDGVGDTTADSIIEKLDEYAMWLNEVDGYVNIIPSFSNTKKKYDGLNIVFTGFRDQDMTWYLERHGASVKSSVSKNTHIVVTPDPNGTSGKLKTAHDLIAKGVDIKLMTVVDFKRTYITSSSD